MQDPNTQPSTDAPAPSAPELTPTPAATPVVPPIPTPEPAIFAATPAPTTGTEAPGAQTAYAPSAQPQGAAAPDAKNHLVAVLLSIFVGGLGVDRFYLGHIGLGVAKLLLSWMTFGIWWLVDVILVATRKVKNVTWEN